ncbi:hypothetical protein BD779DRAFT_1476061 [Infundibulicybe gibba]|nr:hypothetical protein BD779DRAFT_1476061 [Infundibulicybe gibba]
MNTIAYCIRSYKPSSAIREVVRQKIREVAEAEKAQNPQQNLRWMLMGPIHTSRSDSDEHWTARGAADDGSVIATAHMYPQGRPVLYPNGGRWQKKGKLMNVEEHGVPL